MTPPDLRAPIWLGNSIAFQVSLENPASGDLIRASARKKTTAPQSMPLNPAL
jgi:hypothetical protein